MARSETADQMMMASAAHAGRVALVTGAGSGIGAAIARGLATAGAHAALLDLPGRARPVAAALVQDGFRAIPLEADVRVRGQVDAAVEQTVARCGGIDVLVNAAGISPYRSFLETEEDLWDAVIDTNLKGPWLCSKAVVPHMMRRGGGRILNITSLAGRVAGRASRLPRR